MFPSSGFFKGIICPYLASGLCERPYCHYRHSGLRPEDRRPTGFGAGSDGTTSYATERLLSYEGATPVDPANVSPMYVDPVPGHHMPSMLNMVGSAICRVQTRGSNEKSTSVLYRPTPKVATKPVTATNPATRQQSGIPEYTPTPIHLLKQTSSKVDDLEYDPISNYSTKMRPLGCVRITLADAERDTTKRPLLREAVPEAGLAKRPKLAVEVEARFSDEEVENVEKNKTVSIMANKELGNVKMELSSSRETSSALKTDDAVKTLSNLPQDSVILKNLDVDISSKSKIDAVEKNEHNVTNETSSKCETSSDKKWSEDEVAGVSDSSSKHSDTNNKDVKGDANKVDRKSHVGENGGSSHASSKSTETSETMNKENKRRSTSKDNERLSANRHHRGSNDKSVTKECENDLKEPAKHSEKHRKPLNKEQEHSKRREEQSNKPPESSNKHHENSNKAQVHSNTHHENSKKPQEHSNKHHENSNKHQEHSKKHEEHSNKHIEHSTKRHEHSKKHQEHSNKHQEHGSKHQEHSQPTVKHSDVSDIPKDHQNSKPSNEKRTNNIHCSATHDKSNTNNTRNEKDGKSDSKCPSAAQNQTKDATAKPSSLKELDCKTLSRSVSERPKPGEDRTEKSSRRGSLEENEKKHKADPTDSKTSLHDTAEGRTNSKSDFSKSNATSTHDKHRTLSNSSSSSTKTKSTGLIISKAMMKRTISQVELFGEDSDTELDLKESKFGSVDSRLRPMKRSRVSRDTDYDDDSNVSSFDVISESLDESDNPSCSRFEECHQLFLESERQDWSASATQPLTGTTETKVAAHGVDEPPPAPMGKKRVAHTLLADMEVRRIVPEKKRVQPSAAKTMLNRYIELQKAATTSSKLPTSPDQTTPKSVAPALAAGGAGTSSTASLKVKPRVAHLPKTGDFLKKPILTIVGSSKIAVNVRQSCLEKIFNECSNIYDDAQDAKDRAASEEKGIYEKSATKSIYLNLVSNAVRRLRDESPFNKTLSPKNPNACSHEAILGGSKAASTSFTVNRWGKLPPVPSSFSGAELYKRLLVYLMSESQLVENSFPQTNPNNADEVVIRKSERDLQKPQSNDPNQKFCCRCGKAFFILPDGSYVREEECIYHWGHAWKQRVGGTFDNIYNCCGGDLSSRGCQMSKSHVHDDNKYRCLTGYMSTMPTSPQIDGDYGVYALDCEMVYTTFGFELARITVIGPNLELVLDKIVKPDHDVIDYNTRFSGLTADCLKDVTTSIRDIQAILLHMFNSRTILIGHSLESDLMALKLVHNTVVDTSIVFPHRRGPPFKRALQNVVKETLQKIIQNDISGHDSSEDARSCMELMLWKVKEDAKRSLRFA